jgi:hypothetical protein
MHHAFGDPLVVEMLDLLDERKIFEERRAAFTGTQRILIVGDRNADVGREGRSGRIDAEWVETIPRRDTACFFSHTSDLPGSVARNLAFPLSGTTEPIPGSPQPLRSNSPGRSGR